MKPHFTDSTLSRLGLVGFFADPSGLTVDSHRKLFPSRAPNEYQWQSSVRMFPNRQVSHIHTSRLKPVMLPPLLGRTATGTRHFPPRIASDSFSLPPMRRIVGDDRWPGLARRDRPAQEASLETSMTRKRRLEISGISDNSRLLPDYTPGFFREGAPVAGASFVLGRKGTPSLHKLNAFVSERPRPLRRATDVETERQRLAEVQEVADLGLWEKEVLGGN